MFVVKARKSLSAILYPLLPNKVSLSLSLSLSLPPLSSIHCFLIKSLSHSLSLSLSLSPLSAAEEPAGMGIGERPRCCKGLRHYQQKSPMYIWQKSPRNIYQKRALSWALSSLQSCLHPPHLFDQQVARPVCGTRPAWTYIE